MPNQNQMIDIGPLQLDSCNFVLTALENAFPMYIYVHIGPLTGLSIYLPLQSHTNYLLIYLFAGEDCEQTVSSSCSYNVANRSDSVRTCVIIHLGNYSRGINIENLISDNVIVTRVPVTRSRV